MNYYILSKPVDISSPRELAALKDFLNLKIWELRDHTPNRSTIKAGDKVLIYLSNKTKAFVGDSTIISPAEKTNRIDYVKYFEHPLSVEPDYVMKLVQINYWKKPVFLAPLIPELSFIKNKKNYGVYLVGGVTKIPKKDYETILNAKPR